MKTGTTIVISLALGLVIAATAAAQSTDQDPAVQAAKEETAVVFDLGRMFGYISTMDEEEPSLRLIGDQVRELYVIMTSIRALDRIEPDQADEWLVTIEDDILTPAQLIYVDRLYIERASETRTADGTGSGNGSGGGSASGSIATYIAGGRFNPIVDTSKTMGQDFEAFYRELAGRR